MGREFDSRHPYQIYGLVVQWTERRASNANVEGSTPSEATIYIGGETWLKYCLE